MKIHMLKPVSTILIILAAAAAIAGIWYLPLSHVAEPMVGFNDPITNIPLSTEHAITQTFTGSNQTISGFILYSSLPTITPSAITVTVRKNDGTVIGQGRGTSSRYKDGHHAITVSTTWVRPLAQEKISLDIRSQKPGITLIATHDPAYTLGTLITSSNTTANNLSFGIIYPQQLPASTQQAAIIGMCIGLAVALMALLTNHKKNTRGAWVIATIILAAASLLVSLPIMWPQGSRGIGDWDYRFSLNHIYRQTILQHHQFPLWNPYMCGGAAALGDPEFSVFTPAFAAILAFNVLTGYKIALVGCLFITGLGALAVGKKLNLSAFASTVAALIFAYNGSLILKLVEGHVTIIFAYMWLPWVLWSYLSAYRSRIWSQQFLTYVTACGIFLTFMVLHGGMYILSYLFPLLLLLPLIVRQHRQAATITALAGILSLGLSAFQLVPTVAWLREFPDQGYVNSTATFNNLIDVFLRRFPHGSYILPEQLAGWHEYGAYIGYFAIMLTLVGLSTIRRSRIVLIMAILLPITLLLGSSGPILAPFLDQIPFIPRSNISRFSLITAAVAALLSGYGIQTLQKKSYSLVLIALVSGALCVDIFSFDYQQLEKTFSLPPVALPVPNAPYPIAHTRNTFTTRHFGQDFERSYAYTKAGYGTFTFCTVIGPAPRVTIYEEDPAKPFAYEKNNSFPVQVEQWTPNGFKLAYTAKHTSVITVNSNYAPGWQSQGATIRNRDGQLEIEAPSGSHVITVSYHPPGLRLGIIVTLLTITGWATTIIKLRRQYPPRIPSLPNN